MYANQRMRQYQQQSITTASPEQLILKLYDIGISSCHRGDDVKVRRVLVELLSALRFTDETKDVANNLQSIYEFCLNDSASGDLSTTAELLEGLREAWRDGVMRRKAA